jgi:hypothetical protein
MTTLDPKSPLGFKPDKTSSADARSKSNSLPQVLTTEASI